MLLGFQMIYTVTHKIVPMFSYSELYSSFFCQYNGHRSVHHIFHTNKCCLSNAKRIMEIYLLFAEIQSDKVRKNIGTILCTTLNLDSCRSSQYLVHLPFAFNTASILLGMLSINAMHVCPSTLSHSTCMRSQSSNIPLGGES